MFCRNYLQFNRQFWHFVLFCRSALLCRFNIGYPCAHTLGVGLLCKRGVGPMHYCDRPYSPFTEYAYPHRCDNALMWSVLLCKHAKWIVYGLYTPCRNKKTTPLIFGHNLCECRQIFWHFFINRFRRKLCIFHTNKILRRIHRVAAPPCEFWCRYSEYFTRHHCKLTHGRRL